MNGLTSQILRFQNELEEDDIKGFLEEDDTADSGQSINEKGEDEDVYAWGDDE